MNVTRRLEEEFIKKAVKTIKLEFIGYEHGVLSYAAKFLLLVSERVLGAEDFPGKSGLSTLMSYADRVVKVSGSNSPLLIIYCKLTDSLAALSQPKKSLSEVRRILAPKVLIGIAEEYINNTIGVEVSDDAKQAINNAVDAMLGGKKKRGKVGTVDFKKPQRIFGNKSFVEATILGLDQHKADAIFIIEGNKVIEIYYEEDIDSAVMYDSSRYLRKNENDLGISEEEISYSPKIASIYHIAADNGETVYLDCFYREDIEEAKKILGKDDSSVGHLLNLAMDGSLKLIEPILTIKLHYYARGSKPEISIVNSFARGR